MFCVYPISQNNQCLSVAQTSIINLVLHLHMFVLAQENSSALQSHNCSQVGKYSLFITMMQSRTKPTLQ